MSRLLRLRQRWYFFKAAYRCRKHGHLSAIRFGYGVQCTRCGRWLPEDEDDS